MPRITCRTPSAEYIVPVRRLGIPDTPVVIAEAPDFSVPDTTQTFPNRDPLDANRAIRPGEVFFLTPLHVHNKSGGTETVTVQIVTEGGTTLELASIAVPAGETVSIPTQGLSLLKRDPAGSNGDRLRVAASTAGTLDAIGSAEERVASEHIGVVP